MPYLSLVLSLQNDYFICILPVHALYLQLIVSLQMTIFQTIKKNIDHESEFLQLIFFLSDFKINTMFIFFLLGLEQEIFSLNLFCQKNLFTCIVNPIPDCLVWKFNYSFNFFIYHQSPSLPLFPSLLSSLYSFSLLLSLLVYLWFLLWRNQTSLNLSYHKTK